MKKTFLLFTFILLILLGGCDFTFSQKKISTLDIEGITAFSLEEFDLNNLKLTVTYVGNSSEKIDITKEMISEEDLAKLSEKGKHTITINYKGLSYETIITIYDSNTAIIVEYISDGVVLIKDVFYEKAKITDYKIDDKGELKFAGWMLENEMFDFETEVSESIQLIAKYVGERHTVRFFISYGNTENELYKELTIADGEKIDEKLINLPEITGYKFTSWSIDYTNTLITEDMNIYTVLKKNEYNITYIVDDKEYIKEKAFYNDILVVTSVIPEKEGFDFVKWDYDGNPITDDLVVTAIFTIKTYIVNFYDDGVLLNDKKVSLNHGQTLTNDVALTNKENLKFVGWTVDTSTNELFEFDNIVTSNLDLHAVWEEEATIEFAYNIINSSEFADTKALVYSRNISFYDKYKWSGYSLTIDNKTLFIVNTVEITDENTILKPTFSASSCGCLYINNTGKDYTNRLDNFKTVLANGYNNLIADKYGNITVVSGESVTIPAEGILWCPAYNDSALDAGTNGLEVDMKTNSNAEAMIYTNWNEKINVTFMTSFDEVISKISVMPGVEVNYPEPIIIEDYQFVKWDINKKYFIQDTVVKGSYKSTSIDSCFIEVIDGTGSGEYKSGEIITAKADEKINYTFTYWTEFGKTVSTSKEYSFICSSSTTLKAHYMETSKLTSLTINGSIVYDNDGYVIQIPDNYVDQAVEMRTAWVSPITGCVESFRSISQYQASITEMLDTLEYFNMNTVVFHIRIYNDALYLSDLNPKSTYLNTTWDALKWVIDECHKRGIEFHAWMNPYRVVNSGGSNITTVANNIKQKCSKNIASDAKNLLSDGTKVILNPGLPEVRQFLIDTVMEVIENYDVDAIHFDDYFYIANVDDSQTRALYNTEGLSLADWRRKQVDLFIEGLSKTMREYNKKNNRFVQLGISPSGQYRCGNGEVTYDSYGNAHTNGSNTGGMEHYGNYLYSDTLKWINEEWIDYITPQSYWAFTHSTANFADVMGWWNKVVKYKNVKLYAGIGIYMADNQSSKSWYTNEYELLDQAKYTTLLENVSGLSMFKFQYLREYYKGSVTQKFKNMFNALLENNWQTKALTPEITSTNTPLKLGKVEIISQSIVDNKVTISFKAIENARKYVIYRSDGKLMYSSGEILDIVGMGQEVYEITDTLDYSSNYTYTICAISGSNTIGEETNVIINLYNK